MTAFEEDPALVLDCGTGTGIWALVEFDRWCHTFNFKS